MPRLVRRAAALAKKGDWLRAPNSRAVNAQASGADGN
jgi:hypothetical protein